MAKVIQVIETEQVRGNGTSTPLRGVKQYWSLEGVLLAEEDPLLIDELERLRASDVHRAQ